MYDPWCPNHITDHRFKVIFLIPYSKVLLEKLIATLLVSKFFTGYVTTGFTTLDKCLLLDPMMSQMHLVHNYPPHF
jgi:hypothetical protein